MGMGFSVLSANEVPTVFETLVKQGRVDQPIFSFRLGGRPAFDDLSQTNCDGPELFIGGANDLQYKGEFTWTNVVSAVRGSQNTSYPAPDALSHRLTGKLNSNPSMYTERP